jgi:hypothetical protein
VRITPRSDEVKAVVEILESGEFDGPEQMAKALIKEIGEWLQVRDWVALTHVWGDGRLGVNWGPFGSDAEATAAANKIAVGADKFRLVPIYSPARVMAAYDETRPKDRKGFCLNDACGHASWLHLAEGSSRGACGLDACKCPKFEK